jgi:hypothetical protein
LEAATARALGGIRTGCQRGSRTLSVSEAITGIAFRAVERALESLSVADVMARATTQGTVGTVRAQADSICHRANATRAQVRDISDLSAAANAMEAASTRRLGPLNAVAAAAWASSGAPAADAPVEGKSLPRAINVVARVGTSFEPLPAHHQIRFHLPRTRKARCGSPRPYGALFALPDGANLYNFPISSA